MFYKNRFTFLSLLIICAMFAIVQAQYDPGMNLRKQMLNKQALQKGAGDLQIGGKFTMLKHDGTIFTEKNLNDKFSLIFFGYTFCPDICPTTLSKLSAVYEKLTPQQQKVLNIIMVTVDPKRDTQEIMEEYINAFNPNFIGLTGTKKQVKNITKKYIVYYAKQGKDEHYSINHSGHIYLMDTKGKYIHKFKHSNTLNEIFNGVDEFLQK